MMNRENRNALPLSAVLFTLALALAYPSVAQTTPSSVSLVVYPNHITDLHKAVDAFITPSSSSQVAACTTSNAGEACGCQLALPEYYGGAWIVDTTSLGAWKKAKRSLSNDGSYKWTNWLVDRDAMSQSSLAEMRGDLDGGTFSFKARCHYGSSGWVAGNASVRFQLNESSAGQPAFLLSPDPGTFGYRWRGYGYGSTLADDYIPRVQHMDIHAWIDKSDNNRIYWDYFDPNDGWTSTTMSGLAGLRPQFNWRGLGTAHPSTLINPTDNSVYVRKDTGTNGTTLAVWHYKAGAWTEKAPVDLSTVTTMTPTARNLIITGNTPVPFIAHEGTHGTAATSTTPAIPAAPAGFRFYHGIDGDPREDVLVLLTTDSGDITISINRGDQRPELTFRKGERSWKFSHGRTFGVAADNDNENDTAAIILTPYSARTTTALVLPVTIIDLDPAVSAPTSVDCGSAARNIRVDYSRNIRDDSNTRNTLRGRTPPGDPAHSCEYRDPGNTGWSSLSALASGSSASRQVAIPSCGVLGLTPGQTITRTYEVRCHFISDYDKKTPVATPVGTAQVTVQNPTAEVSVSVVPPLITSESQTVQATYTRKGNATACEYQDPGTAGRQSFPQLVSQGTYTRNVVFDVCPYNGGSMVFSADCTFAGGTRDRGSRTVSVNIPRTPLVAPDIVASNPTHNSVSLTWNIANRSSKASRHVIEYRDDAETSLWTLYVTLSANTRQTGGTLSGLSEGTLYRIRMRTESGSKCNTDSGWDTTSITTALIRPGIVTVAIENPVGKEVNQPSQSIRVRYTATETPSFCEIVDVNSAGIAQGEGVNVPALAQSDGGSIVRTYAGPATRPTTDQTWTFQARCTYGSITRSGSDTLTIKGQPIRLYVPPRYVTLREGQIRTDAVQVRLTRQPPVGSSVTVTASESSSKIALYGTRSLTFTRADWDTYKNIAVRAWHDADSSNENNLPITLRASGASSDTATANVTVIDDEVDYTVSVSTNDANLGSVFGGGSYRDGTSVTVRAVVRGGSIFGYWYENGRVVSSQATYSFIVDSSRTLQAIFIDPPPERPWPYRPIDCKGEIYLGHEPSDDPCNLTEEPIY